ncbi:MAG: cysteine desulfurase [Cellulomonadaceae bacterium]|nr:cysteine desulfurase [Cellulomonadaceae bacterium]
MGIYLDYAATAGMSAAALAAYCAAAGVSGIPCGAPDRVIGNPSSLHAPGRRARQIVEDSRETIAECLGANPSEVVFTNGGTEANNLAIKGAFLAAKDKNTILVSAIEHHSVLEPAAWLAQYCSANLKQIPVDKHGIVDLAALKKEANNDVALISVMLANNEIGTIEPIGEIVVLAREKQIPVHTDAIAALGQIPINFGELGVDMLSVAGHKVGGPAATGALLVRRKMRLEPLIHGGGQERGLRAGTQDVPAIAAFAAALAEATTELAAKTAKIAKLRDELVASILANIPSATLEGPPIKSGQRLPGNALFTFAGAHADDLLLLLDLAEIAASTGAACTAGVTQASHVLLACGVSEQAAHGALRFTLGPNTTQAEIAHLCAVLPGIVAQARKATLAR